MSIYLELIGRVHDGEPFHIDFEKRNMKVGKKYLINDSKFDEAQELISGTYDTQAILDTIEELYKVYKYSLPSERSENKRKKYFKALPMEEITDEQLMVAERREVACATLEGFILCMIVGGQFMWDEKIIGKWFWQCPSDSDLIILKSWVDGK